MSTPTPVLAAHLVDRKFVKTEICSQAAILSRCARINSEVFVIEQITQIPNCMNGARTLKIHQDGASPGLHRPTSTTGDQPLYIICTQTLPLPPTIHVQFVLAMSQFVG